MTQNQGSRSRYLVVSDMHVCDIEDHADGWKRYKSSAYVYDTEFDAMVREFVDEGPDDELTLILNGDIFDFDLVSAVPDDPPWPVNAIERKYGLYATDAKSSWKLRRILSHHPVFVDTLARLLGAGHKVVLIAGNHDREVVFEGVTAVFVDTILAAVQVRGETAERTQIIVEAWFYHVEGQIYAEHGHQYDWYSAYRYNLDPFYKRRDETYLALPMGNLSNRYLLTNIGYFNPHATDFIMSAFGYLKHWLKHYAFTRRMLILTWLVGSLRALATLVGTRRRLLQNPPEDYERHIEAQAQRYQVDTGVVKEIYNLREPPITNRLFKMAREFWIDRLLLALFMTGGTIALALSGAPLWVKLMVPLTAFPLLHFIYEWFAGNDNALTLEYESHTYAHEIAKRLPVRVVTFGHTHVPNIIPLAREVTYANSGTWAPVWGKDRVTLAAGLRNYVMVAIDGDDCRLRLGSWMDLTPSDSASISEDRPRR